MRRTGPESEHEERALKLLGRWAEGFGLVVCVENLCSTYPGPAMIAHDPQAVRGLVRRCESDAIKMVLDLGHANVVADLEGKDLLTFIAPVLDDVALFHVHDNLGARRRGGDGLLFDPLRLDLHLPPGVGAISWRTLAPTLARHSAPLMLEIHPSWRSSPVSLREQAEKALGGAPADAGAPPQSLPSQLI
jgi:sugar phosphate isomerase/epimerase